MASLMLLLGVALLAGALLFGFSLPDPMRDHRIVTARTLRRALTAGKVLGATRSDEHGAAVAFSG
jgi:hypothetical protein